MMNETSSANEERLHALSHAVGIVLGIIGFFVLLHYNTHKTTYATVSLITYASTIIILFTASTWYHAVSNVALKQKLRILDHISIYILIAGTYTPVALITLINGNGWTIFYTVWSICLLYTSDAADE